MDAMGCEPDCTTPSGADIKPDAHLPRADHGSRLVQRSRLEVSDVVLGWGRSSTVRLGRYVEQKPDGSGPATVELVAVKMLHLQWCIEEEERVTREISHHMALSAFRHPFIVRMLGVELDPTGLAMVMEFKEGVQTLDKLQATHGGRLPQSVARQLFLQLMIALEFCHRLGLSNRDCKVADLLVHVHPVTGDVRLQMTDFSFAKDSDLDADSDPVAQHGSALFAAPEVITASHAARYSGAKADVWSAGVVLCTLLFGCHPHLPRADLDKPPVNQIRQVLTNAMQGRIVVPEEERLAQPEAYALMASMLTVDPTARPTSSQVLQHPWLRAALAQCPELGELNNGLLGDERLRAESAAAAAAAKERVTALLDSLLGSGEEASPPKTASSHA